MFRLAHAEADAEGQIGLLPQPAKLTQELFGQPIALAGDSREAHAIEKARRLTSDLPGPFGRCRRCDEHDHVQILGRRQLSDPRRLLHGQVRNDQPAEPGAFAAVKNHSGPRR